MSPAQLKAFLETDIFRDYADHQRINNNRYRGYGRYVVERATKVAADEASPGECEEVYSFLNRSKGGQAGPQIHGTGRTKVSARSSSLMAWGFWPGGAPPPSVIRRKY